MDLSFKNPYFWTFPKETRLQRSNETIIAKKGELFERLKKRKGGSVIFDDYGKRLV